MLGSPRKIPGMEMPKALIGIRYKAAQKIADSDWLVLTLQDDPDSIFDTNTGRFSH
jgi:hypothetical protein